MRNHYAVYGDSQKIIGRKKINGRINYLVWWNGYRKSEATWEPRRELIKDVPKLVKEFDLSI